MRAAVIHFVRPRGTPLTHNASPHLLAYMRAAPIHNLHMRATLIHRYIVH
jgi:hypothetical protein